MIVDAVVDIAYASLEVDVDTGLKLLSANVGTDTLSIQAKIALMAFISTISVIYVMVVYSCL